MFRFPLLLVISAYLLFPIDSEIIMTFVFVPFQVTCKNPFFANIRLLEIDDISFDDVFARFTVEGKKGSGSDVHQYEAVAGGIGTDDAGKNFEFKLEVEHNCGGTWKKTEIGLDKFLQCRVGSERCDYPKLIFNLSK